MKGIFFKFFKFFFKLPFSTKFYLFVINRIINKFQLGTNEKFKMLMYKRFYLNLRLDDWLQQQIYFLGKYEAYELKVLESRIMNGGVVIDIGANIGLYSLYAASIIGVNGEVISFEPYSLNFDVLNENIALNNYKNITTYKTAISNIETEVELFYNPQEYNLGMVSVFEKKHHRSEIVSSNSLDNFLLHQNLVRINYIKLDIEGGEYLALLGMKETLKKYKPFIQIEIDDDILSQTSFTKKDILMFFENNQYQPVFPEFKEVKKDKWSKNYFFEPVS